LFCSSDKWEEYSLNKKGQFSIIAALLVAVILITTVMITYSTIRNSQVQNQPLILSAIDETNLAVKQVLGFTVGYYGSILQVTGNQSYAITLARNYLQSGLLNIASMNPQWGTSFNVSSSQLYTYWYTNSSYSTGNLAVNYNLTGLGISGVTYQASCKLSMNATNGGTNQARLDITQDEDEPLVNLGKRNFLFYRYSSSNSTWLKIAPTDEPLSYANGTYIINTPTGVDPHSFLVQAEDSRGIIVVASSFSRLVYDLNFTGWNNTAYAPTIPDYSWWNASYMYRKLITITNNAASSLTSGYSISITLDTASLVSANKMLSNGNDLRIVHWNGSSWVEIDRDIISGTMNAGSTQVWFKTQAGIGSSPSATNDYYLYYGNPSAGTPPANKTNVYLWFDDFNRPDEPDITTAETAYTKTYNGTWSIEGQQLKNVGADGDPNKLIVKALGNVMHDVEMTIKLNVSYWGGDGDDHGRMGLSSNIDNGNGEGYCALFHQDRNSLDLLNDARAWGTYGTYSWATNTWYQMKFRVINPSLKLGKVKVWQVGTSEPTSWTVDGNIGGDIARGYGEVGIAGSKRADITYFDDFQVRYVVDPEPSTSLGPEEVPPGSPRPYLAPTHLQDATVVAELLQDGTIRWLGQNLQLTTSAKPFLPIPIKSIHVNETTDGVDSEVPFQVEDWASGYTIPLGLTSNASVFGDRNMLVFLANPEVSRVTIWWNGSDLATQTPYAYTDIYFKSDNIGASTLTNGILTLHIVDQSTFTITSAVGGSSCTSNFMRINQRTSGYYSDTPAWVITNGIVRDIIHQEPEWSGGVSGCYDFYGHVVITLPALATYFTYQLSLMFLDTQQSRSITDLCPITFTGLTGQPQVENGLNATGYPLVSNATGLFYNASSVWQHHWSQFVQGTRGAGIMFTDDFNQKLYTFDSIAGNNTGALDADPSGAIGLLPVTTTPATFNNSMDAIWYGAVVTFDGTTPIYNNGDQTGLWILVEHPPIVTPSTEN
jgi:hypothetical protein